MISLRLIRWPGRNDGSYESTEQPRWAPGEVRDLDDAAAAGLMRDFPGSFESVAPPAPEAPPKPAPRRRKA
jgi:hypothetical protein